MRDQVARRWDKPNGPRTHFFIGVNRALITTVLAIALAATAVPDGGYAAPVQASRLIDRTFSRSVPIRAGARERLIVSAVSGFRDPDNKPNWKWKPRVSAQAGEFFGEGYAGFSAGAPPTDSRNLTFSATLCRPTSQSIPLATRSLSGGTASQLQGNLTTGSDAYECRVTNRVLIRIRASFRTPVALRVQRLFGRRYWTTTTPAIVRKGELAVAAESGQPLAYASASESGPARLFGSTKNCVFE